MNDKVIKQLTLTCKKLRVELKKFRQMKARSEDNNFVIWQNSVKLLHQAEEIKRLRSIIKKAAKKLKKGFSK